MSKTKSLLLAALLSGLAAVSFAQTPAAGAATDSATALPASKSVAKAAVKHDTAKAKKVTSKKRPAKKDHAVAKKHVAKHAA